MENLLLPDSTFHYLEHRLDEFKNDISVVRMREDGSLMMADQPVVSEDCPIHIAWLSLEVFRENLVQDYLACLTGAPHLRWMQTISAGLDNPFFQKILERGVRLCNSDAQAPPIAEYVVASVLYRYQHFNQRIKYQRSRQWASTDFREIYDSNWLIIGFGNIGHRVGRMVRGFEGNVKGVKRSLTRHEDADEIITFDGIADALPGSDVVVLACALTDETRGLVDKKFLDVMKKGAILVNIARGAVVDEAALLETLDSDHIDCAILDVFRREPLPVENPLWDHPRVLLTPHASSRGLGTGDRWTELFLHNLRAYLRNDSLRNEVDLSFFE